MKFREIDPEVFNLEMLDEFWTFVYERQEIYHRRFVEKLPAPWTKDKVLQTVFFTNVYRELDAGTIYLAKNVRNKGSEVDELFETLLYRQFNNRWTYQAMVEAGREFGDWSDWRTIADFLTEYGRENKTNIFTEAHMTTGIKWGGFPDKASNVCWLMHQHWENREQIYKNVKSASSLGNLCRYIASLDGYGPFLAYEVGTDLHYSKRLQKFTENDWVNPGPGCRKGIDVLIPDRSKLKINYEDVIEHLRENQLAYFDVLQLQFKFVELASGEAPAQLMLSLRNVEHSLCEYFKYHRAKHTGKARRKYHGPRHG